MSSHSGKVYGDAASLSRHSVVSIPHDDSMVSLPRTSSTTLPRDDSNSSLSTNDSHGNMTCYRGYTSRRKSQASMDPRLPDSEGNPNIPSPEGHSSRKSSREERDCGKGRSARDEECRHHRRSAPHDSRDDLHYRDHHYSDDSRGHQDHHHRERGCYHNDDPRRRHGDRARRHRHRDDDMHHHEYSDDMRSPYRDDADDYAMYYNRDRRRSSSCKERRVEHPYRDASPESMYETIPSKRHGSGSDSYHSSLPSREGKPRPRKSSAFTHETQRSFSSQDIRPNIREHHHRPRAAQRNIEHTTRTRSNGSIRSLDSKHSRDGQSDHSRSGGRRGHDSDRGHSDRMSYGSDSERGRSHDHVGHHVKESDSGRGRSRDHVRQHGKESDRIRSQDFRYKETESRRRMSHNHSQESDIESNVDKGVEQKRAFPPELPPISRERPPPVLRQRKSSSDMLQVGSVIES